MSTQCVYIKGSKKEGGKCIIERDFAIYKFCTKSYYYKIIIVYLVNTTSYISSINIMS